ncbi:MAG: aminotransferase class III-fold pyridoxal phosphate-dependent enzyme, partial [Elusimicrobiota bacterium]
MYDTLSAAANAAAQRGMSPPRRRSTAAGDRGLLWHPYTQMLTAPAPIPIARAKGARLYGEDGRVLIDAIGSWWVNIHGHCHPRLVRAVRRQIGTLDHVLFAGFTHAPAVELARKLAAVAPRGLTRVFYSDDGSTAVEVALKMALQYWRNKGRLQKRTLAAFENAYHGDTAGAMSVSARSVFTRAFEPMLFPVLRVPEEPGRLEGFLRRKSASIAAVIVEPLIQAAGGMRFTSPARLARLAALCRRHEVLLIADEVMTGFGRTGKMFACEEAEVIPDIICLSKALTGGTSPLAATVAR